MVWAPLLALAAGPGALKPLKPDVVPGIPWLAFAGFALLGLALATLLRRRKPARPSQSAPSIRTPQAWRARLERARHEGWIDRGEQVKVCEALSDAVRHLALARFGVGSLRLTTAELLSELEAHGAPASFCDPAQDVLSACDLVKFAGVRLDVTELKGYLETALILVQSGDLDETVIGTGPGEGAARSSEGTVPRWPA